MPAIQVSDSLIQQHSTSESYARGVDYLHRGAVSSLTVRDNVLTALVQGSEYAPYTVRATLQDDRVADASCTCLYGYGGWCKHIVAALLAAGEEPERVEERPSLLARLDALDRDALHALLHRLIEREPEVEAAIERMLPAVAAETGSLVDASAVDPTAIKARIGQSLHSLDRMRPSQAYWHVGGVVSDVERETEPARGLLDAGQPRAALEVLRAVIEAWNEQWPWLDDSDGEASSLFYDVEPLLIEALLSASLSKSELNAWADRIDEWIAANSDYGVEAFYEALAAARNGWDEPHLLAVLRGETDVLEPPDAPELEESDQMIAIRLRVLARLGQDEEALRLAAAAGHVAAYALALIRRGQLDEAVSYALSRATRPAEAHEVASGLHAAGARAEAMRVAAHGLELSEPERTWVDWGVPAPATRAALADWLRGVAEACGDTVLARKAAGVAATDAPSLDGWREARRLAGDDWDTMREELLARLRRGPRGDLSGKIDIFLSEGQIDDAIKAVRGDYGYTLAAKVADAATAIRPDWVIATSRSHAEQIMDRGQSDAYHDAARWLARMKEASRHAGQEADFRAYLDATIAKHHRKYKLVPLLRELQR